MLTCYRTRQRLGAWLDGALDEGTAQSTAAHVATCGVCQREVAELRRLHTLVARAAAVPDPDWAGFWPGVVRGIQDRRTVPMRATARRWRPQWALGGALAAALLVSLGLWEFGPRTESGVPGVLVSSASTGDPRATVMVYGPPERDVAVVWVLGLDD